MANQVPPETATERASSVIDKMRMERWEPTTKEVAAHTGLSHTGALLLMYRISRVIEIYQTERQEGYRWRLADATNSLLQSAE